MDFPVRFRSRILSRAAVVALLASVSAGCTMERFGNTPLFTGATGNQRTQMAAAQPMPPALVANAGPGDSSNSTIPLGPSSRVTTSDLPPPPSYPAETVTAWNDPGDTAISQPPAREPRQIGTTITVSEGDTLYSIARRANVPVSAIAAANGLTTESHLRTGQSLLVPSPDFPTAGRGAPPQNLGVIRESDRSGATRLAERDRSDNRGSTPPRDNRLAAAPANTGTGEHVVRNGETMYSLAIAYGVTPTALATANGMTPSDTLRVGQRLAIPGGRGGQAAVAAAQPANGPERSGEPVREARLTPPQQDPTRVATDAGPAVTVPTTAVTPGQQTANASPNQPVAADEPSTNGTTFRWPVRGRIISGFGAKPGGERNDGINLAVPSGTSVKAAEAGTVIYSGNEIAGYGNLILIRHAGGWVTAYAHNSEVMVNRGDKIQRGQIIAKAGATGSVSSPQVHFELRRGQTPVNPLDYLSGA